MSDIVSDLATAGNLFSFMFARGYHRLCPVIPPGAEIDPTSRIASRINGPADPRGKAPGIRQPTGLWNGIRFTTMPEATEEDLKRWFRMGANVGVRTGRGLVAIDIDVTNRELAVILTQLTWDLLGHAPVRFGRQPKSLLIYRITGDVPYSKVSFSTPTEAKAAVEILYEGRQFVAKGIHPGTGRPYEWRGLVHRDALPEITPEQLETYLEAVATRTKGVAHHASGEEGSWSEQWKLRGDPALVRDAVAHLPNRQDDYPTRDAYISTGYAIKSAMGPDLVDEALDLYLQWCGRWDGGDNNVEDTIEEWERMHPPFRVGAQTLYLAAEKLGNWTGRARLYLEPVLGPVDIPDAIAGPQRMSAQPNEPLHADGKKRFELLSVTDILALPDPKFLVDRHIPEIGLGFLYGRPGCGKSFMCLDLALHAAYGLPSWHQDALNLRPEAHVLYLAREGSSGFKARIKAWQGMHAEQISGRNFAPRFSLIRQTINFMQPDDIGAIVRTVREAELGPMDLIVVDTVSRVLPGADENLQKEMTIFVQACDALNDAFGGIVLGVHHAGKNGDMRGSSVLRGAGDFVFRLDREPGSSVAQLWCEKQKDAQDGWCDRYRMLESLGSLVPFRVSAEEDDALDAGAEAKVLAAIGEAWEAGKPWSREPHTATAKGGRTPRYGPLLASRILEISAAACETLIEDLHRRGLLEHAHFDRKTSGWRVKDVFN
jgi:hypothetical protein